LLRILGYLVYCALALLAAGALAVWAFLAFAPQVGADPARGRQEAFAATGHYADGKFLNQVPTDVGMRVDRIVPILRRYYLSSVPDKFPSAPLPVFRPDAAAPSSRDSALARVTWFGHSACLLEIAGRKILFDPMFGDVPAPLPFLAARRFPPGAPIDPGMLPRLDAVVISHDHYDHLDYGSILKLKDKADRFLVPLGVGAHLERWGVDGERIREMDWGDSAAWAGVGFVCAPARHFSGRRLTDNSATLWASWVIRAGGKTIYFSGDTGYGPHFREIGRRYGPFDLAMMDCGQYDRQWPSVHMRAEESVQAARELGARLVIPIHWAAFALALHAWYEPAVTMTERARAAGLPLAIPRPGEPVRLDGSPPPSAAWWR
jgi:L-ascorbate metabolism protein UlaG (beta-lactamase superfamily)